MLRKRQCDVIFDSTEDMLHSVTQANQRINETGDMSNLSVMSMDAAALFPSLNMKDILSGLWRLVLETPMSLLNLNMKEIGKYLYIMYTRDELVKHRVISCIPKRQVDIDGTGRRPPTLAYLNTETYD